MTRLIETFQIATDESVRPHGEALNLEISPPGRGYRGFTKRVPVGSLFLHFALQFPPQPHPAHKIAPAIAAGCPFILKPASPHPRECPHHRRNFERDGPARRARSPSSPCAPRRSRPLYHGRAPQAAQVSPVHPKLVGHSRPRRAKKKVVLELGGNAAAVLDDGIDLDDAVERLITGAFYQSATKLHFVQRILVHATLAAAFEEKFVAAAAALVSGDPSDEATFIGPMIAEAGSGAIGKMDTRSRRRRGAPSLWRKAARLPA